jgi:hypothetical protein
MAVLAVSRLELEEAKLTWLLVDSLQDRNYLTEIYYWDTSEHPATICLLAGIGTILGTKPVDINT